MSIHTIRYGDSLDTIWGVLVYEEARLLKDKDAADLAPEVGALIERWSVVHAGQRSAWRAEITAQAGVDACDDVIDDTVDEIDDETLRAVREDRGSPRYRRYFRKPRREIVRLGLESELDQVRAWPASLRTEPEPALQALGARLEADIALGDAAVAERREAIARTSDHRVREIVRFIDDVNASRRTRYGILIQRATERGLDRGWPERFFKRSAQRPKKVEAAPAGGPEPTA